MDRGEGYRYWAFISYSHADEAWAKWLHKALETYRVPRRIAGTAGRFGPRPSRLLPIFRDRDELSSAGELGSVIEEALRESRYLIVICSPNSARSQWVDAEIRRYKARGRGDRVLALIVDGEPNAADPALECFPPALRRQVDARGELTDAPAEPLAADARPFADHKHGARLKLIAGLLGIGYDDLRQREKQRRFWRRITTAAAVVVSVTLLAGLWQWREQQLAERARLERLERLTNLGRKELEQGAFGRAGALLSEAARLGPPTPTLRTLLTQVLAVADSLLWRIEAGRHPALRIALNADGTRVAAVFDNAELGVWQLDSKKAPIRVSLDIHGTCSPESPVFSVDSRHVYVTCLIGGTRHSALSVIDVETGRRILSRRVGASNEARPQYPFHPTARETVFSDEDGIVRVVALADGSERLRIKQSQQLRTAIFSPDGKHLLLGSVNGSVGLWERASGRLVRQYPGLKDPVTSLAFSEDGTKLIAGAGYGAIRVWDTGTAETLAAGGQRVTIDMVRFSRDGSRYFSIADDGVRVWESRVGALVLAPTIPRVIEKWAALSPDGHSLLLTDSGPAVLLSSLSGQRLRDFDAHPGGAFDAAFSADGSRVAVAGTDGRITIWRNPARPRWHEVHGTALKPTDGVAVLDAVFSPDGQLQAATGTDGIVRIRHVDDHREALQLPRHEGSIGALLWTTDGSRLLTVQENGVLRSFASDSGQLQVQIDTGVVVYFWAQAQLSADGKWLALAPAEQDAPVHLIDLASGRMREDLPAATSPAALAFMPQTGELLIGSGPDLLRVKPETGARTPSWSLPPKGTKPTSISVIAVSADGSKIFAAATDGRVFVRDGTDDRMLATAKIQAPGGITSARFSDDGRHLAFADASTQLYLWDWHNVAPIPLAGHTDQITSLEFSPQGERLMTASYDGTMRLWSVAEARPILIAGTHASGINRARLHPDGMRAITASADNSSSVWDVGPATEPVADIVERLRCATAWRVEGETLALRSQQELCLPQQR